MTITLAVLTPVATIDPVHAIEKQTTTQLNPGEIPSPQTKPTQKETLNVEMRRDWIGWELTLGIAALGDLQGHKLAL